MIKDIYIYNVEGKLLKKQSSKIILLDSSGTYFLKIVFSDNSSLVIKTLFNR